MEMILSNAPAPLDIPTYEGSGECVHPDVIAAGGAFYATALLMGFQPYPGADHRFENPSIVCSDDGRSWSVPDGVRNPIVPGPESKWAWNSDGDLARSPAEELFFYYRYNSGKGETGLFCVRTRDGRHWQRPQPLFEVAVSARFVSPAVVWVDGRAHMFYVDVPEACVRYARSGDGLSWETPERLFGFTSVWHLDVTHADGYFYLLLNDKHVVFLLRSADIRHWFVYDGCGWKAHGDGAKTSRPLLGPSCGGWDDHIIYRASGLVEGDALRVWYSAQSMQNVWRIGYCHGILAR